MKYGRNLSEDQRLYKDFKPKKDPVTRLGKLVEFVQIAKKAFSKIQYA